MLWDKGEEKSFQFYYNLHKELEKCQFFTIISLCLVK